LVLLSIKYLLCSVRISAFQPYGSVPLVMRFKSILTSPGIPIWRFKSHGYELVAEYYDAAISGADPIGERPGFQEMLKHITGNSVRHILVESPDRFARDLAVQLAGHDFLKGLGVTLVPASAPDFFIEDTPAAVLVRQVLGAIAQFERRPLWRSYGPPAIGGVRPMASARAGSPTPKPSRSLSPRPSE
jgi:hypothetical protein